MSICSAAPSWAELMYDFTFFAPPNQHGVSASGGGNFAILDKPSVDLSDLIGPLAFPTKYGLLFRPLRRHKM